MQSNARYLLAILSAVAIGACSKAPPPEPAAASGFQKELQTKLITAQPGDVIVIPAGGPEITSADFGKPQTWGAAKNVVAIKHLYISGQPDEATLIEARDNNVAAIINMRDPDEIEWDEEAATVALGIDYYNIPVVSGDHGFDASAIDEITRLVGKYKNQKILLHCSSGNRVSGWLAVHLVKDHGIQIEPAIDLAKLANLTKPSVETRVREFFAEDI